MATVLLAAQHPSMCSSPHPHLLRRIGCYSNVSSIHTFGYTQFQRYERHARTASSPLATPLNNVYVQSIWIKSQHFDLLPHRRMLGGLPLTICQKQTDSLLSMKNVFYSIASLFMGSNNVPKGGGMPEPDKLRPSISCTTTSCFLEASAIYTVR
jgi:hypothetical protein